MRRHQIDAAQFLITRLLGDSLNLCESKRAVDLDNFDRSLITGAILADEMGTGKVSIIKSFFCWLNFLIHCITDLDWNCCLGSYLQISALQRDSRVSGIVGSQLGGGVSEMASRLLRAFPPLYPRRAVGGWRQ